MKRASIIYYLGLAALVAILFYNHFFTFFGHYGSDDMYYALLAKQLNDGSLQLANDNYAFRWGVLLPAAFFYHIFGINDFSSALPAFFSTLLCLVLIHRFTKGWNYYFRFLAISLFLLNQWTLFYADKLMPDAILTLFVFIAFLLMIQYRSSGSHSSKQTITTSFFLSLSLICALMVKETVALFMPLLIIVGLMDMVQKRFTFFWMMNLVWGIVLFSVYLFVIKIVTGSFSARLTAINAGNYLNPCSYDQLPLINTLRRIGYEVWRCWIDSGQFIPVLLIIPTLSLSTLKSFIANDNKENFLLFSAVILVLCANFMSISLRSYIPMCPDPRHFLYLSPILALAGASALRTYYNQRKKVLALLLLVAATSFYAWHYHSETCESTWLPLTISLSVIIFIKKENWLQALIPSVIIICLLARNINYMNYSATTQYFNQKKIIKQYLENKNMGRTVVYTDLVESRYGFYYNGFDSSRIVFISYPEAKAADTSRFANQYVLINPFTSYYCNQGTNELPPALKQKADKAALIVKLGDKELKKIIQ